jgi:hypothetical protein
MYTHVPKDEMAWVDRHPIRYPTQSGRTRHATQTRDGKILRHAARLRYAWWMRAAGVTSVSLNVLKGNP